MRLALYLRFSLRSPRIDLWSLICSTHPLVTAQRGRVSLGKMLVRLVNGGLGAPSPRVVWNPVELLLNDDASFKEIGVSFFWIALEASAEEMSLAMSTFPPIWTRSARLKGATYVHEMAMLLILAGKEAEFELRPNLSIFCATGRPDRGQLGTSTTPPLCSSDPRSYSIPDTAESDNGCVVRETKQPALRKLASNSPLSELVVISNNKGDGGIRKDVGGNGTQSRRQVMYADEKRQETEWEKLFRDKKARHQFANAAADSVAAFLDVDSSTIKSKITGSTRLERQTKAEEWCRRVVRRALDNFAKSVSFIIFQGTRCFVTCLTSVLG
jgi:hypothetical protein